MLDLKYAVLAALLIEYPDSSQSDIALHVFGPFSNDIHDHFPRRVRSQNVLAFCDLTAAPAMNDPPGPGGVALSALAALWSLLVITFVFVLLRLYTRIIVIKQYGIDDHCYNAAFVRFAIIPDSIRF